MVRALGSDAGDLTKNVWEVFGPSGYIRTSYSYAPFGAVSASGDVTQPFQWSSEHYDSETALVYYNFRHYSPDLGRWLSRDPIEEKGGRNLYAFVKNNSENSYDFRGRCAGNIFECAIGHVWDGISCVATGIGSGVSCAAGYVWDGAMCVSEFIVAGAKRIIDGVVYVWDGARWLVEKTIEFILGHCGSGTLSLLIVPDRPFFIASVSECCIEHDNCYATLCASKKDCDDALGACVKSKISSSLGIADLGEYPSSFIGEGYRLGVHLGGGKAFEDAQKEAKGDCLRRQK